MSLFAMFVEMFSRLAETIDRNSEVMQCAMDTMETLSQTSSRTPVPDDGEFIIPDNKRSDKVSLLLTGSNSWWSYLFQYIINSNQSSFLFVGYCRFYLTCQLSLTCTVIINIRQAYIRMTGQIM